MELHELQSAFVSLLIVVPCIGVISRGGRNNNDFIASSSTPFPPYYYHPYLPPVNNNQHFNYYHTTNVYLPPPIPPSYFYYAPPPPPPPPPPPSSSLSIPPPNSPPESHANLKFTSAQLEAKGFPKKRKQWKKEHWKRLRELKGWKEGFLADVDVFDDFTTAGVKSNVFTNNCSPLEIFNYFMEPIKKEMEENINNELLNNKDKYSSYKSTEKEFKDMRREIDRYLAALIEIRCCKKRSMNMSKWWSKMDEGGNLFIQQCLSRNKFKLIKSASLENKSVADIEKMLNIVKDKTHQAIKLPLYVIVDECMVKARIHHLLNRVYMPDKPIKNGLKFWVIGCSFNGIPVIWEFNQCKTDTEGSKTMVDVVTKLVSSLEEKGHIVLTDRGFGSIDLANAIAKLGHYFLLSCKSDRPTEVFSQGIDKEVKNEGDFKGLVGTLESGKPVLAAVYHPPTDPRSRKSASLVHCLTNACIGKLVDDDGEQVPDMCKDYRKHYHEGPDQFDAKEALLRDPHKHMNTQAVLFHWCLSVVLSNSYAIYCLKHNILTTEEKDKYPIGKFLYQLRNELVPPCKLEKTMGISEKTGKPISNNRKCCVCESSLGKILDLQEYRLTHVTNLYCARCNRWMHWRCQFAYSKHTPPDLIQPP